MNQHQGGLTDKIDLKTGIEMELCPHANLAHLDIPTQELLIRTDHKPLVVFAGTQSLSQEKPVMMVALLMAMAAAAPAKLKVVTLEPGRSLSVPYCEVILLSILMKTEMTETLLGEMAAVLLEHERQATRDQELGHAHYIVETDLYTQVKVVTMEILQVEMDAILVVRLRQVILVQGEVQAVHHHAQATVEMVLKTQLNNEMTETPLVGMDEIAHAIQKLDINELVRTLQYEVPVEEMDW